MAWHPLGWDAAFFSEIEAFPSAALAHRYPTVPNFGDMTKFQEWPDYAIDLLVGGTPCQSFSVAGLRAGLADPRGNLMLTYLAIAARYRPRWVVWENVPGVLSSNGGRDFGTFLRGMVELGYGFAYRVLDAQYVRVGGFPRAVPQRPRRVFVVGYLGDWRRAAAVLFDGPSLRGHPAPRREAGQGTSADVVSSLTASGRGVERTDETRGQDPVIAVAGCMPHQDHGGVDTQTTLSGYLVPVAHALRADGFDASEDGTGRGTPLVPVAFSSIDDGGDAVQSVSPTLRKGGDGGFGQGMSVAFDTTQITSKENGSNPQPGDPCHPLAAGAHAPAIAFDMRGMEGGAQFEGPHDTANIRAASGGSSRSYVAQQWAVRRLTPTECARLQGFPDDYLDITYRGKPAADGPKYKALGNSMAVNVMRWIGERIELVEAILQSIRAA